MYWIRQLFCNHEWDMIMEYENSICKYKTYRCKKCGKSHMHICGEYRVKAWF